MNGDAIRKAVRERYGSIAATELAKRPRAVDPARESCGCGPSCCSPEASFDEIARGIGYGATEVAGVPEGANMGLGCGNPIALASLEEGETVLDLGSGGGFDCFLAAERVGTTGAVIGVDMTPDMIELARRNAARGGYTNVEFRLGEIESLPIADGTVDAVISNCVINLSADPERVFRESFRALRPGGRLMISDLLSEEPVPAALVENASAFVSCLPVQRDLYLDRLRRAGFVDVEVVEETVFATDHLQEDSSIGQLLADSGLARDVIDRFSRGIRSAKIAAVKPPSGKAVA